MYQRLDVSLPNQGHCFPTIVSGTANAYRNTVFADYLDNVVLLELTYDGCHAH